MKRILTIALLVLVASMIAGNPAAYADPKTDSLVNLATQARSQIKIQLDRSSGVSADVKELFAQGDSETDLLIAAAKDGNTAQAQKHFMAAMKIFRQITQTFSEPAQQAKSAPAETMVAVAPTSTALEVNYRNNLIRAEKYLDTLKTLVAKNGLLVDFAKADELVKSAKASMSSGNLDEVERLYGEIKSVIAEIQGQIKEQTAQRTNDRVRAFVNDYIVKIDAILDRADELGLSDGDIAKLTKIKEELETTRDANQLVIKIKRYSVTINAGNYTGQNVRADPVAEPAVDRETRQEAEKLEARDDKLREDKETKQERKLEIRNPQMASEISRLEAALQQLEQGADASTATKLEAAKNLLNKAKSQAVSGDSAFFRTAKALDSLIGEIQQEVQSPEVDVPKADQEKPKKPKRNKD
ncbi:MAG: hypothetical protein LV468_01675 [Candidatus Nitrosotenuis sp.]|nr:hypothetical protein [Candidatus Nitrosotenuis sp.]